MQKERENMRKSIKTTLMIILSTVFVYSCSQLLIFYIEYRKQEKINKDAVAFYVQEPVEEPEEIPEEIVEEEVPEEEKISCPIEVNFDKLLAENSEVVGWIYCEDSNINYPVVQGKDNDYYLNHSYTGEESKAGAIFVDAENSPGFADCNTIIYGHHMKNGGMFAKLKKWGDQEFYEAHPVMWLLTPEQNYRVDLFAGYLTPATSDTYLIFRDPGKYFDVYLSQVVAVSDIQSDVELPGDGHYVILSTCEYDYQDARYVLYGLLTPADGAE